MTNRNPVQMGTIGFGIMGERLLNAGLDYDAGKLVVSGAWDPAPEALSRLKSEHPNVNGLSTLDELLQASDCVHEFRYLCSQNRMSVNVAFGALFCPGTESMVSA